MTAPPRPAGPSSASFPKPVIARIRGFCLGGGLGIALQADLRIAAIDSEFGIPAARLGTANGIDMVRQLAALIGPAHAKSHAVHRRPHRAAEAGRIGLVNQVVRDRGSERRGRGPRARHRRQRPALGPGGQADRGQHASRRSIRHVLAEIQRAVDACADSNDYAEGPACLPREAQAAVRTGNLRTGQSSDRSPISGAAKRHRSARVVAQHNWKAANGHSLLCARRD